MIYADTSALVKMVVTEAESTALRSYLVSRDTALSTSQVGAVELGRSARRRNNSTADRALALLSGLEIFPLTTGIAARAQQLEPSTLRTLDAIHVATAIEVRADLVVTYDQRMIEACHANGLEVVSPGAS